MTDVIKIARHRQARLAEELALIDDFISMAEALVEHNRLGRPAIEVGWPAPLLLEDDIGYDAELVLERGRLAEPATMIPMAIVQKARITVDDQITTLRERVERRAAEKQAAVARAAEKRVADQRATAKRPAEEQAAEMRAVERPTAEMAVVEHSAAELLATAPEGSRELVIRDSKTYASFIDLAKIAAIRLRIENLVSTVYSNLASRGRIERRFNELKGAYLQATRQGGDASGILDFKGIVSIRQWVRDLARLANTKFVTVDQLRNQWEKKVLLIAPVNGTAPADQATPVVAAATEDAEFKRWLETRPAPAPLAPSIDIILADPDQFSFSDETKVEARKPSRAIPLPRIAATADSVDVRVGQKLRQRRWMVGMSKQQLAELIGVKSEQIKSFEAGAEHIGADKMWDIAAALEVPMAHFFEGLEGEMPESAGKSAAADQAATDSSAKPQRADDSSLAAAKAAFRGGAGFFASVDANQDSTAVTGSDATPENEDELVLTNQMPVETDSAGAAPVDIHVGQMLRQRRWMMGMTKQQFAERIGATTEEVQQYETGATRIGAGRMWEIAGALEVPVSFFFEGLEGQAPDAGVARAEVLTDDDALTLVNESPRSKSA